MLNGDEGQGPVLVVDGHLADGDNRLEPFHHLAKDDVLPRQVRARPQRDEELRAVRAGRVGSARASPASEGERRHALLAAVGHAEQTFFVDLTLQTLVLERAAVDGLRDTSRSAPLISAKGMRFREERTSPPLPLRWVKSPPWTMKLCRTGSRVRCRSSGRSVWGEARTLR